MKQKMLYSETWWIVTLFVSSELWEPAGFAIMFGQPLPGRGGLTPASPLCFHKGLLNDLFAVKREHVHRHQRAPPGGPMR